MNDEDFECIERFVVLLYDITSPCISVNECCKFLFTKKCRTVEIIPPAKAVLEGLEQYIKRATLQKGKSVMVLNEIPLDTFTSKVFYNKIILFMK